MKFFGNFVLTILFGPEKTYTIMLVLRDRNDRRYWHVLTECGSHLIFPAATLAIGSDGASFYVADLRRGDEMTIRMRGKGIILLPWSKIERDPFGLKNKKESR